VGIGVVYTCLEVVARFLAERLVSIFDALHNALYKWDPLYHWWWLPLIVIRFGVLFKAGYELWKEEKEAREKAEKAKERSEAEKEAVEKRLAALQATVEPPPSAAVVFEDCIDSEATGIKAIGTDQAVRSLRSRNTSIDDVTHDKAPSRTPTTSNPTSPSREEDVRAAAREAIEEVKNKQSEASTDGSSSSGEHRS